MESLVETWLACIQDKGVGETRAYATKQRLVALDRVPIIETKEKQSGNEREFFLDARCQLFSVKVHAYPRLTE